MNPFQLAEMGQCVQAVNDIRGISDEFVANGNAVNTFGLSNMVWGFGQFVGMSGTGPATLTHSACTFLLTPLGKDTWACLAKSL